MKVVSAPLLVQMKQVEEPTYHPCHYRFTQSEAGCIQLMRSYLVWFCCAFPCVVVMVSAAGNERLPSEWANASDTRDEIDRCVRMDATDHRLQTDKRLTYAKAQHTPLLL